MASIVLSGALNEVIGVRGFLVSTSLVPETGTQQPRTLRYHLPIVPWGGKRSSRPAGPRVLRAGRVKDWPSSPLSPCHLTPDLTLGEGAGSLRQGWGPSDCVAGNAGVLEGRSRQPAPPTMFLSLPPPTSPPRPEVERGWSWTLLLVSSQGASGRY